MNRFKPDVCEDCRKGNRLWQREIDCSDCTMRIPELTRRNQILFHFFQRLGGAVRDGFGGINLSGIEVGLRVFRVPESERGWIFESIIALLSELFGFEKKERDQRDEQ